jgi:hypothetical protein
LRFSEAALFSFPYPCIVARHLFDVAKGQLDEIEARFPKSLRVQALEGMMLEAQAGSPAIDETDRKILIEVGNCVSGHDQYGESVLHALARVSLRGRQR